MAIRLVCLRKCVITHNWNNMNYCVIDTQAKIGITYTMLYNYLWKYQRRKEIFMIYKHENIVANDIDQQMTH